MFINKIYYYNIYNMKFYITNKKISNILKYNIFYNNIN